MLGLNKIFRRKKSVFEGTDMRWLEDLQAQGANMTPDLWKLQRRERHLVFLYNECQEGQYADQMLGINSEKLYAASTKDTFVLWKKKLGLETFPIMLPIEPSERFGRSSFLGKPARVTGQIFRVPPMVIKELDSYVLNTVQFERQRIEVIVPYRRKSEGLRHTHYEVFKVWVYVGRKEFWKEQLDANKIFFDRVTLYTAKDENIGDYYYFKDTLEANKS